MKSVPFLLAQAALDLELPPIVDAVRLQRGAVETWRVDFADAPAAWVRLARPEVGLASILAEQAAVSLGWAHGIEHLPAGYRAVRVGGAGVGAHLAIEGSPASALPEEQVDAFTESVGRWLGELQIRFDVSGTFSDGHSFLPCAADWNGELRLHLEQVRTLLRGYGAGLGAVEEQLVGWIEPALEASPGGFTLVHRDLAPHRLWAQDGELVGVFGWERAWVADPLYQWASLVLQPPAVLAALVRGSGARHVYDPAIRSVLKGYAALEVLSRLASQVHGAGPEGNQVVPIAQALAVDEARRLEQLDARLDAARQSTDLDQWPGWRPDPVQTLVRRYLRLLAERERRHDDGLELGLAAVLLGASLEAGPDRERWLGAADRQLKQLERPWVGPGPTLPADPSAPSGVGGHADRARWLWGRALTLVPDVDPAVHTGLGMRLAVLAARDRHGPEDPRGRLLRGLTLLATLPDAVDADQLKEDFDTCTGFDPAPTPSRAQLARTIPGELGPALLLASEASGLDGLGAGPLDLVQALMV